LQYETQSFVLSMRFGTQSFEKVFLTSCGAGRQALLRDRALQLFLVVGNLRAASAKADFQLLMALDRKCKAAAKAAYSKQFAQ
jgi:hypothetical protein